VPTSPVENTIPRTVAGDQCPQEARQVRGDGGDGGWGRGLACMLEVLVIVKRETYRKARVNDGRSQGQNAGDP
jgi:hypothetical protein